MPKLTGDVREGQGRTANAITGGNAVSSFLHNVLVLVELLLTDKSFLPDSGEQLSQSRRWRELP